MSDSYVDYQFIEKAFKKALKSIDGIRKGKQLLDKMDRLDGSLPNFKAFLVLGGSYQERMMTANSDIDFWILLYSDETFKLKKRILNRLARTAFVEPAFEIIQTRYPSSHPCSFSFRRFREFTEDAPQDLNSQLKRISAGMKIINFGKVVEIENPLFGNKAEFVAVRREFNSYWREKGYDVWDVWGDLSNKLDRIIMNLRRYKGKSLYRNVQLPIQQIATAYGFPDQVVKIIGLQEKLMNWVGRPRFVRRNLKDIGPIINYLRNEDLRVSKLKTAKQLKLGDQLKLFSEHIYKPFRLWVKLVLSLRNIVESAGIGVSYFGISKTHGYLIFTAKNPFDQIKGIDIERADDHLKILANLGRIRKREAKALEEQFSLFHESKDSTGEVIHVPGINGRSRTHALLLSPSEYDVLAESVGIKNNLMKEIQNLQSFY